MKKLIDENGRLFGRISLIDVVVIAVALVLVVAFYTKGSTVPISSAADPMTDIRYEVTITNMPDGRLNSLRVGDELYDKETKLLMGTIADIQSEECVISMLKADGTYVMAPIEGRYNVKLVVDAKAMVDEHQLIYVNRAAQVAVGLSIDFYTQTSLFGGTITGMER